MSYRRDKFGNFVDAYGNKVPLYKVAASKAKENAEYKRDTKVCPTCKGKGKAKTSYDHGETYEMATCFRCDGSGRVSKYI